MILFIWPNSGVLFLYTTAPGVYLEEELFLRTDITRELNLNGLLTKTLEKNAVITKEDNLKTTITTRKDFNTIITKELNLDTPNG